MTAIGAVFFPPLDNSTRTTGINPTGWDRCTFADKVLPALVEVQGAEAAIKVDYKIKKGAAGANATFHGMDPGKFALICTFVTDADREAVVGIVSPYVPRVGQKDPKPVSLDHPSLRLIGISSATVIKVGQMENLGSGKTRMKIELLHYAPTDNKKAAVTPKGAPVRKVDSNRKSNPPPTQQPGAMGPPAGLKAN